MARLGHMVTKTIKMEEHTQKSSRLGRLWHSTTPNISLSGVKSLLYLKLVIWTLVALGSTHGRQDHFEEHPAIKPTGPILTPC